MSFRWEHDVVIGGSDDVSNEPGGEAEETATPVAGVTAEEIVGIRATDSALRSVWNGARRLLPAGLDAAFARGMTGSALRHTNALLLRSDLTHWLAPGLRFCGVQLELVSIPRDEDECLQWLHNSVKPKVGVPIFAYSAEDTPQTQAEKQKTAAKTPQGRRDAALNSEEAETLALTRPPDLVLAMQARIVSADTLRKEVTLEDAGGNPSECSVEELQTYFTDAFLMRKSAVRGRRPEHRQYALRAWTTFACAYPARVIGMEAEDASLREIAADFWRQMAGKDRSVPAARLREVSDLFQNARDERDIGQALRLLYKQTCLEMRLPLVVENALLAPGDVVLSEAERRELIYLARAGTRDLKILALSRLWHERDRPDALSALQQLRFDADVWVRAAASG